MENKFADRMGNIMISNGIARLDFLTLKEIHKETNKADFELAFRLNIPVDGIMQAIDVLEKMKADLLAQQSQTATSEPAATSTPAKQIAPGEEKPQKAEKRLTREEFEQLPREEQERIRERAKLKEQERIKKQLGQ